LNEFTIEGLLEEGVEKCFCFFKQCSILEYIHFLNTYKTFKQILRFNIRKYYLKFINYIFI